ncbi:hypothetical protein CCACVL1_15500 [Corchorus capsularis]|uniref:Terpene synthase metal-binding domain-containing protein n=1 Tax=Corchorus capsularis TaxID=210143 RepID=A0A1R3I2A2_COCAP|nr:hypothetical protein CCACVL1_15500 [Corchorus capsularis]
MDYNNQLQAEQQIVLSNYQPNSEAFGVIQQRRSANYKPNIWKYDFLQSLGSKYDGEEYKRRADNLKQSVKAMFDEAAKLNFNAVQATLQKDLSEVSRWDFSEIQQLPECMKICFRALYDITNEIAYDIQEHNGWINVQPLLHLRKAWAGFCKALFVEAKWYNEGYTPSLEEYLSNALISSGGIVISVHSMLSVGPHDQILEEMLNFLGQNEDLVYNVSIIIRLCNDLGTSVAEKERGDAPSSILCYMREVNVSEEQAQEHIKDLITNTWKKINGQSFNISQSPSLQSFVKVTTNIARMVHCLYQFGDGFGIQDKETRRHILSLLIEPYKLD